MSSVKKGEKQAITAIALALLPLGALGLMVIATGHQIRTGTWEVAFYELLDWTYGAGIVLYPIALVLSIFALRNGATIIGRIALALSVIGFICGPVRFL